MGALIDPEQAERLRRTNWGHPATNLAMQELYAMFTSDAPYNGPVININQTGGPVINIIGDGTDPPITTGPPILPGNPTNPSTTPVTGGTSNPSAEIDESPPIGLPAAFPLLGWGIVQSKVSGNVYVVDVYLNNPASSVALGTMNVVQRQIDPTDTIPAGTEIPVMLFTVLNPGGLSMKIVSACMQVPVFLERP